MTRTPDTGFSDAAKVEAVLFVSGRPVSLKELAGATDLAEERVAAALAALAERYAGEGSALMVRRVGGGFQLATDPDLAPVVERYRGEARPSPLSGAALEVLSCVLYLGPVTRAQISRVRGVNSDAVVRGMIERGLLVESGRDGEGPGAPSLLDLSEDFFIASGTDSRESFPNLDSLVSEEELSRVRERVLAARGESPGEPVEGP